MDNFMEEMSKYREEPEYDWKYVNKMWASMAYKMGTVDEDIVSPVVIPLLEKYFNCEIIERAIRFQKWTKDGRYFGIDVLAVSKDKVFMIEIRANPSIEYIQEILEKAEHFREFFPVYNDKELVPIIAGFVFNDDVINYANKKHLYIMAYREWEYMDIINFDEVKK